MEVKGWVQGDPAGQKCFIDGGDKEQFSSNMKASVIESQRIYLDRTGSCPVSSFHGVKALAKALYHKK